MKYCATCKEKFDDTISFCPKDGEVLEEDPASLIGSALDGQYQMEALLGKGGMGAVYRARHILLGDRVAIKLLPPEMSSNTEWLRRFQREGQAARRFRHPNAVTVYDLRTSADGTIYLVMEYVEGNTLDAELKKRGKFSPAEAVAVLDPVMSVLNAAHAMGVVHRDLKPENILVTAPGLLKIMDFGIALDEEARRLTWSGLSSTIGTPDYMAPEQISGRRGDARTDIYALGTILYEMFTGELPYTSDTSELTVLRSGTMIDYGYLPTEDASQSSELASDGYTTVQWQGWGTSYFLMNFQNPKTGPIIAQAYLRQAMQSLIDEPAYLKGPLEGYGHTDYGPVPVIPSNPYIDAYEAKGPWPYSPATAIKLLSSHGWAVKRSGVTTCTSPGSGAGHCGAGIAAGTPLSFSLQYANGILQVSEEMQALKSSFAQAGIQVSLTSAPFDSIISLLAPCTKTESSCSWQMLDYGGGWTYGVDPYPTGDQLFATGSGSNASNYSNPEADKIIAATVHGPGTLTAYENYAADQIPVLWMPQPVYQISEISKDLHGTMPQSPIESLTPEDWYLTK